jgi:hypothetical protein
MVTDLREASRVEADTQREATEEIFMATQDTNAMLREWLKDKKYSDAEIQIILDKLAKHDRETLSDAVFDSIGGGTSLEEMIGKLLKE